MGGWGDADQECSSWRQLLGWINFMQKQTPGIPEAMETDTLQVRGVLLWARTSLPQSSCVGRCFLSHCHLCLQNTNMHQSHSSDSWVQQPVPHSVAPKYNCTTDNLAQRPESCKAHHKVPQFSRKLRHELALPMTPGNPQWENPNKILKSGNTWQFGAYIFMHHNCQAPDHRKPRSFSSGTCLLAFPETYIQRAALPETYCSYVAHMPQRTPETHTSVDTEGQKELSKCSKVFFFRFKCKTEEKHEVTGKKLWQEQRSYSATSSVWPPPINNRSLHARLFNRAVYTHGRISSSSSAGKRQKNSSWEYQCGSHSQAPGLHVFEQKVTHTATTATTSHSLGSFWAGQPRDVLESILQSCAKRTSLLL